MKMVHMSAGGRQLLVLADGKPSWGVTSYQISPSHLNCG